MLEVLRIFPLYLIIVSLVFVIIPAVICSLMRILLYRHLQNLVKKTRRLVNGSSEGIFLTLVEKLRSRFREASQKLEQVNTWALIEGIYNQEETFSFFKLDVRCETGESITRTLPNLLIALGLLGTFFGITLNLYDISQIINEGGGDVADLTTRLQSPLESMGIAFISSLIALLCSSILIVVNLRCNTNLAKNSLFNNLEDYLDNVYKPLVEGDTRLDKAVNKMVSQQQEFLVRFHEKVGEVLQNTFAKAANRIAEDNEKAQQLATQVYQGLLDASGAINNGAGIFKNSMVTLEEQVKNVQEMMPKLNQNVEEFNHSSDKILTAANQIEASKFSENLEKLTLNLVEIEAQFTQSTQLLNNCISHFTEDNKKATELATQVYQQFQASSEKLKQSADIFAASANTIKDSKFNENLVNAADNLASIQQEFNQMAVNLSQIVKPIETNVDNLKLSTEKMIKLSDYVDKIEKNINAINSNISNINSDYINMSSLSQEIWQETKTNLTSYIQIISAIKKELLTKIISIDNNQKDFVLTLNQLIKSLESNVLKELNTFSINSNDKIVKLANNVDNINSNLNKINLVEYLNTMYKIQNQIPAAIIKIENNQQEFLLNLDNLIRLLEEKL